MPMLLSSSLRFRSYHDYPARDYRGKRTLGQSGSFKVVEQSSHWRTELKAAVDHGKTVIVFLAKPEKPTPTRVSRKRQEQAKSEGH